MKKLVIEIEHNLSPLNEKIMLEMVNNFVQVIKAWWNLKSKKTFKIKIN